MEAFQGWLATVGDTFDRFFTALAAFLPNLLGAILLVIAGWVLARILRTVITRVMARLDDLVGPVRDRANQAGFRLGWPISTVIAQFVFWLVILFFVTAAAAVLGLPGLVDWLDQLVEFAPAVFACTIIVLLGYLASGVVGQIVASGAASARLGRADLLGRIAAGLTLVLAVILGVSQLGLDISLLVNLVTIAVAALLGGAALAFGIGAGPTVGNIMASHYVNKIYRVGQTVRINELEGKILEVTPTSVILETEGGHALVPAKAFNESASVLIEDHGDRDR